MQDFTAGGIHALPNHPTPTVGDAGFDERIRQLVADFGCNKSCELIEEMISTALKMGRDQVSVADLKLFNRSLKELRQAARVFAPYRDRRKVVVFGSARTAPDEPESIAAETFARNAAAQAGPDRYVILDTLARILAARGDCSGASTTFRQAIDSVPPAHSEARSGLEHAMEETSHTCKSS